MLMNLECRPLRYTHRAHRKMGRPTRQGSGGLSTQLASDRRMCPPSHSAEDQRVASWMGEHCSSASVQSRVWREGVKRAGRPSVVYAKWCTCAGGLGLWQRAMRGGAMKGATA